MNISFKYNLVTQLGHTMRFNQLFIIIFSVMSFISILLIADEPVDVKNKSNSGGVSVISPVHSVQDLGQKSEGASLLAPIMPGEKSGANLMADKSSVKAVVKSIEVQKTTEIIHVKSSKQFTTLLETELPILVDFSADWSAPCDMINDAMSKIVNKADGKYKVARVDVDMNYELKKEYAIKTLPTVIVFVNGKEVDRNIGVQSEYTYVNMLTNN